MTPDDTGRRDHKGQSMWQQTPDRMKVFYVLMAFLTFCVIIGTAVHH